MHDTGVVRNIIDELLDKEIIKASYSEYSSPIVLVSKKDGTSRMCWDFRHLNKFVQRDNWPIPNKRNKLRNCAINVTLQNWT